MEARRFWLMVWWALWAMVFAGSFVAFWATEAAGDGFTRGLNRVTTFLGWQGVAGMLAFGVLGTGRGWPPGSAVRRWSRVPLALAALLALGIAGFVVWGRYFA